MSEDQEQELVAKYGKPMKYEQNFRGPLWRRRSCTDVPCLIIFAVFLCAWGYIASYAFKNGDLNKLMVPTDSMNQKCGIDSQVLDKPYLFFFNLEKCIDPVVPLTGCPTPQVCVQSCPTETFIWDTQKNSLPFEEIKKRLICLTDEEKYKITNIQEAERAIQENRCARWYIKSAPFLNRCMWEFSPQVCEYIPTFLLNRNRRDLMESSLMTSNSMHMKEADFKELQLQALALTATAGTADRRVAQKPEGKLDLREEPAIQCRRRTQLGETVIKEKMRQTDTRLAKFVGNLVAHFYNGTHDAQKMGEEIVEDLVNSWFIILMALLCTLVASLIFIALMRWLAAPFLWFSILGVLIGLVVGVFYTSKQYVFWKNTATVPNHSLNLNSTVKNLIQDANLWLVLAIILAVSFIVIFLLVIVLWSRISIAIALTKEGSKAVSSVISTVFFPIFSWCMFVLVIVFAIVVGLYLGSIGENHFRMIRALDANSPSGVSNENCVCEGPAVNFTVGQQCDPQLFQRYCYTTSSGSSFVGFFQQQSRVPCSKTSCSFVKIENSSLVQWFIFFDVFGFFWLTFFISAFTDMVLAATFATWYWTFKKRDVPFFTLTKAFAQTAFFHMGTLAFGSLILTICRMIRVILEYIDQKCKKFDNTVTRAILCFLKCFFWLLETFLRFLNRNAYIMCAIHGKNFCSSAKDAFNLVMRNFLRVITLDKVTDFLFFLSKILLTGGAGVATYYFLLNNNPQLIQLNYNAVPTAVVVVGSFLITSLFFGVYSMAVDTLFLCFLEDCERNDGTPEKPYFMSKQLMRILGKRNKFPRQMSSNEEN